MAGKGRIENLKSWKKGQSGNPKGRPPKLINSINKDLSGKGYSPANNQDVVDAYLTLIQLPLKEVKDIASGTVKKDLPFLYKLVAKELLGKKGSDMLERLLDRALGKAKTTTDITSGGDKIQIPISSWVEDGDKTNK